MLAGLLRCGHCGRKLRVMYNRKSSAQYHCDGAEPRGTNRCLIFGAKYVDDLVGEELCRAVEPAAVEAAERAFALDREEHERSVEQARLRMQAAQYAADRAFEQYDLADPKNRLVVDNLEMRLNEKLAEVKIAREGFEECLQKDPPLTEEEKEELRGLASELPRVWRDPGTPTCLRKQLMRIAIREVVVVHKAERQELAFTVHWNGDVCTELKMKKRATPVGSRADTSLTELVGRLSPSLGDGEIARILNMKRLLTPRGLRWTMDRVENFRVHNGIRKGKPVEGEDALTGQQAREYLGIGYHGLLALIRRGVVHTNQVTDFAPWRIPRGELDSEDVQELVRDLNTKGRLPAAQGSPDSQRSLFPEESSNLQKDAL